MIGGKAWLFLQKSAISDAHSVFQLATRTYGVSSNRVLDDVVDKELVAGFGDPKLGYMMFFFLLGKKILKTQPVSKFWHWAKA